MEIAVLTDEQKEFLKNYHPADEMFTSFDEIKEIENKLELGNSNVDHVRAKRNAVVVFYHQLRDEEFASNGRRYSDAMWNYNTALMSVTAAIDNFLIQNGSEV